MWQPHEVVFRQHGIKVHKQWNKVMTVDGESDVRTNTFANKAHPKVYIGFYSHASFPDKCDMGCGDLVNSGPSRYEYRSSDWWRIPSAADFHLYSTIPQEWTTRGPWKHLNNPWSVQHEICTF